MTTTLHRRARRACPMTHRRGAKRCISCVTIEGEMLHMLRRIERAAIRATARGYYFDFKAAFLREALRDEPPSSHGRRRGK